MGIEPSAAASKNKNQKKLSPPVLTPYQTKRNLVGPINRFGIALLKTECASAQGKNVMVSPLSVGMALGMAQNGAAGKTLSEMRKTLELGELSEVEVNTGFRYLLEDLASKDLGATLEVANSIWVRSTFRLNPDFDTASKRHFSSEVRALDFALPSARDEINRWISDRTHGTIKTIVDQPIQPMTALFLINGVYFKGTWEHPFDKSKTKDGIFNKEDGQKKTVKMMTLKEKEPEFRHLQTPDFDLVALPYKGFKTALVVLVPRGQKKVRDVLSSLTIEKWEAWFSEMVPTKGDVVFPRLEFSFDRDLKETLSSMGMKETFSPKADFSRLAQPTKDLYIAQVRHKTQLKIDEEGTEISAATAVEMPMGLRHGPEKFNLVVDRPFLFALLRTDIDQLMFLGLMVDPPIAP